MIRRKWLPIATCAYTCAYMGADMSMPFSITFEAIAGALPDKNLWGKPSCDVNQADILRKHELRKLALVKETTDNAKIKAQADYAAILQKHKADL